MAYTAGVCATACELACHGSTTNENLLMTIRCKAAVLRRVGAAIDDVRVGDHVVLQEVRAIRQILTPHASGI